MEKAFEVGDKALGILEKLLGPWFTRRQVDANTRAALQEVLTDQVATHMEAYPNDPVMMEALMSCHGRFGFKNIVRIVQLAVPQLDESARPGLISEDWGANFRDKANTCSDPEMAELWAQLLAAEVNNPGVQRQLLLPVPSIILAGSPPVSDYAAGPLRCGSWGRRIPG